MRELYLELLGATYVLLQLLGHLLAELEDWFVLWEEALDVDC
jgi:hypothetical protein